ncbi:MAG: carboxylesterase family protein, partial [Candidatus Eremiobacteraeota bacterium]|nr:carboxylesterase family protein [Candidatus Eremiobacteraeota bacterium]
MAEPNATSEPQVRLESGVLAGVASGPVVAYKGIPYAAPPVGERRWRPPAAARPWSGVRRAADYGASCIQANAPQYVEAGSRAATLSEDCLTLNVWTPVTRASALPVMVWLHGGANVAGAGSERFYDATAFARDGAIAVTLNYRLGLFGFFAHKTLTDEAGNGDTANFGLLDQISALRWVHANISAFGGDPADVTIFGESAGGEDALVLATSAAATGLFRRAIGESASDIWEPLPTLAQASARGAKVA